MIEFKIDIGFYGVLTFRLKKDAIKKRMSINKIVYRVLSIKEEYKMKSQIIRKITLLVCACCFVFVSCSDEPQMNTEGTVLSPVFLEFGNSARTIDITPDKSTELFYLGTVPALSDFSEKKILAGGTFPIKIMDRHVNMKYEGTENGIIKYNGESKEKDLYLESKYDTYTDTFSYMQVMSAAFNSANLPEGMTPGFDFMLRVVKGDGIVRNENGNLQGRTWAYEGKGTSDGNNLTIQECEYFSNDKVTAVLVKNVYNASDVNAPTEEDKTAIASLTSSFDSKDVLIQVAESCIKSDFGLETSENPNDAYYCFFYYDKTNKTIMKYGIDEKFYPSHDIDPCDKDTVVEKAKEISGGEWIISI